MKKRLSKITAVVLALLIAVSSIPLWIFADETEFEEIPLNSGAPGIDYDAASDGSVLYEVDFSGTDGIYHPFAFRYSDAIMAATTVDVQDNGKTIIATAPASAGRAWFWGSPIKGLTLGEGKKYTITFQMSFPSGCAGFYFNFGYTEEGQDPLKNNDYNGLYGIFGRLNGNTFTLSRAAGSKQKGEIVSDGSGFQLSPVIIANDTLADIKVEIDGFFYSIWITATATADLTLFDQLNMCDITRTNYYPCENLGFSIYLYNNNASTTVKNVVITKGCSYDSNNSIAVEPEPLPATAINYASANNGDKLADLFFNSTVGSYVPTHISQNSSATTTISNDGKTYSVQLGDTAGPNWFGSTIGQLKITDSTKYTFKYKLKAADTANSSTYITGIAYNSNAIGTGARYNWHGTFSDTVNAAKYAYNGTNFLDYNYPDENQLIFKTFEPLIDADGFIEVAVELNGWIWTYYEVDTSGKYVALQTIDNKALTKDQLGHEAMPDDNLAFIIYTYNRNVSASVKNVELFKGLLIDDCAHCFTKQNTNIGYLKRQATSSSPAQYYYSCIYCGKAGTEVFEYGEPLGSVTYDSAIRTAEDFASMIPDGNYFLDADIALTEPFMEEFTGSFDGKGHTITLSGSPVFSKLSFASLCDIVIEGIVTGEDNIGALASEACGITASEIINKASVTTTGSGKSAGGIIGNIYTFDDSAADHKIVSYFIDCENEGVITGNLGNVKLGGIVGYVKKWNKCIYSGCLNKGNVLALDGGANNACVAGIAGSSFGAEFYNCINEGNLSSSGGSIIGGILAYMSP